MVSADQRDAFGTYEMLDILQFGAVEIHRATAAFSANGKQYPAGSFVIKTAQPYGGFANTMLSKQVYPDLRMFPGGPPEPPYDVTGHTLWMLTGVSVDAVAKPFDAPLELVKKVAPMTATVAARPKGAYLIGPESYGTFKMIAQLQKANVPVYRASKAFDEKFAPGTWVIPSTAASQPIVEKYGKELGIAVSGVDAPPSVEGERLKPNTKVGLYKAAGNMPARLADVDARAVRHQSRGDEGAGLRRRSEREVRRHHPAVGHRPRRACSTASTPRPTIRPSGRGRSASAMPAGRT